MTFRDRAARSGSWARWWLGWAAIATPALAGARVDPAALAVELTAFGPRHVGSPGYVVSQEWLLSMLQQVGLDPIQPATDPVADGWLHLTGEDRGTAATVLEVTAHYDTA